MPARPAPPDRFGDQSMVDRGAYVYARSCVICHGAGAIGGGVLPDLRFSPMIASEDAFRGVMIDGTLAERGMVSFAEMYSAQDAESVRAYLVNMTEYDPIGSFHLHAETFDVYPSGTSRQPTQHTDTVTLGQGERAVVEFTLPEAGRYMFHPHQIHMAERGAMGWFAAV